MTSKPPAFSRGDWYESVFDRKVAAGEDVNGEARFVLSLSPRSVLDAGCGTGRIGRELALQGVEMLGFDVDPEMLGTTKNKAPGVTWIRNEVTVIDLKRRFSMVLLAGNVINFVEPQRRPLAVMNMSHHLDARGALVTGHAVERGVIEAADFDRWASAAGLRLVERWSTWQRAPFSSDSGYAVSIHRKTE